MALYRTLDPRTTVQLSPEVQKNKVMKVLTIRDLKAYLEGLIEGREGQLQVMKDLQNQEDVSVLQGIAQLKGELAMAQKVLATLQIK